MKYLNNELNDLFDYGYSIYQNDEFFKFSIDSVLLAEFVKLRKKDSRILDLCSGNCPIPMILNSKFGTDINVVAVEVQKTIFDMANASLEYNDITNVAVINDNIVNLDKYGLGKFDVVVCNPPYFPVGDSKVISLNNIKAVARHEIMCNLDDVVRVASMSLKNKGYFYMVHRAERLVEIINV